MENEKFEKILEKQLSGKYYQPKELEYGNIAKTFLSPFEYKQFLEYKETIASTHDSPVTLIPLPTFKHKCIFYCLGNELSSLLADYTFLSNEYLELNDRFSKLFIESRIYSEIEGTLNVENVPTTHKRLKELLENDAPVKEVNDIIIKNMKAGIDFVNELPAFNKDNLLKLYNILSKDCLDEDNKLLPNKFYRHDSVEIGRYYGCVSNEIEKNMDAFIEYVNETLKSKQLNQVILLPHIAHYYILYIHPYFDYNGRTSRMVSYWIYLLSGLNGCPPIISEAINQTKSKYYKAIELSRDSHNDITYFLIYLLSLSNDYILCYQNLNQIEKHAKNKGYEITATELNYIKKVLISYDGVFSYPDFLKMINVNMSKQGALKVLNKFIDYGFLKEVKTKSKSKFFDINEKNIPYLLKNFGYRK